VDNSILIVVAVACGVALVALAGLAAYSASKRKPGAVTLAQAPSAPLQAYAPADPGYELMTLLDRHAKSRAGNRVIDGAAEAMADDTVAALVRGASTAKGGPSAASPAPAPAPPNG
jgi:hypothetical protein